jgi:membrane protein required for colicin V production
VSSINWFDVLLTLVIFGSVLSGLRTGFARVIVGLIATILGFMAGFWCYHLLAASVSPWIQNQRLAGLLSFLFIFFAILVLGAIVGAFFARLFKWIGLSWFDHLLGAVGGAARGVLVAVVLADVTIAFSPWKTPDFLERSRLMPYVTGVSGFLAEFAPRELKDAFNEQMQNLKKLWETQQPQGHSRKA